MQIRFTYFFIITLLVLNGCSQPDNVYILNADIPGSAEITNFSAVANRDESANLLLAGHYVKPGNRLVLMIRKWDRGDINTIDDELFEKLTIAVKDYKVHSPLKLDSENVKLYYSRGGSAWVSRGSGYYSDSGSGSITIKNVVNKKIELELDIKIIAKFARTDEEGTKTVNFKGHYSLKELDIKNLTPWLGKADKIIDEEVYP